MDELLKKLGQLVKEKEQTPMQTESQLERDCWDRLAASDLSDDEIEHLRQEATQSSEVSEAMEAFAPFDASFDERLTDLLANQLNPAVMEKPKPKNPSMWSLKSWFVWMPVAAGAAACALALIIWLPFQNAVDLPAYSFAISSGVETTRGAQIQDKLVPIFTQGTLLEVKLRPAERVTAKLAVAVYRDTDGQLSKIELPWQQSSNGAIRFRAVLGQEVQLKVGEHHLVFVVASQGHLPNLEQLRQKNEIHSFQVFEQPIRVVEQLP